jgi:hypothetical protein
MNGRISLPVLAMLTVLSSAARAEVTFLGDWRDFGSEFEKIGPQTRFLNGAPVEWVAGHGANHWRIVQERGEDRLRVEHDPASPNGSEVLRVEVRPGDNVGYTGERAEVSHMLDHKGAHFDVSPASGHEFYAIAVKLAPNWQAPGNDTHNGFRWGSIVQLHSPDDFDSPPAFSLAALDEFSVNICVGDLVNGGLLSHNKDGSTLALAHGDLRRGHWVQFLIDVVWANDDQGSLTIYRRDAGERSFVEVLSRHRQPTLQFRSSTPHPKGQHYWKVGYYRSTSPDVTSRLWLGPFVRGTSREEVVTAAFGPSR